VLALPSDSWLDGSESWWCHGAGGGCQSAHTNSVQPTTVSTLSSQPQDCLVGDSCIIVQLRSLVEDCCVLGAGDKVLCTQCRYELGRLLSSGSVIRAVNTSCRTCLIIISLILFFGHRVDLWGKQCAHRIELQK